MFIIQTIKNIFSKISKILIVVVVFFVVINLFFAFTSKDKIKINPEETTKNQRAEIYKILNDPQYQKTPEGKTSLALYRGMLCTFIGEACTDNPADADKNYNKSIMGFMGNLIAMPYANPPASGVYYAYDTLQNAGFVPKAYAAEGIGFASLKPLLGIWKAFRNVAYLILVIVLIAIGFMIMFRMKLNPQTVISMENTLPKIIVSMILITFSFAIAGFLIDLMYVTTATSISILSSSKIGELNPNNLTKLENKYLAAGPYDIGIFEGFGQIPILSSLFNVGVRGQSIANVLPSYLRVPLGGFLGVIGQYLITLKWPKFNFLLQTIDAFKGSGALTVNVGWLPALISLIITTAFLTFAGNLVLPIIFGLILTFTLFFLWFRILFMLLIAYLKTLLLILFAPILLIFNAIPGRNVFSFWFKNLIGELLTFPLTVIVFLVGYAIVHSFSNAGLVTPPFLYGIKAQVFADLLGIGIVLVIPNIVKGVKEVLGLKGLPLFGLGPGTYLGGVTGVGKGAMTTLAPFSSISLGVSGIQNILRGFKPK